VWWGIWIRFPSQHTFFLSVLILSSHARLNFPKRHLPFTFPVHNSECTSHLSHICTASLTLLDFITVTVFGDTMTLPVVCWLWPTLPISRLCTSLTMAYGHWKVANNTVSTLRTRADVRHAWLDECALHAMWEKLKLIYDGGDSGNKKCKQGSVGAHCRVWRSLRLPGVWNLETGSRYFVCAIGSNLVSLTVKMFSHLI
jgi:hypothetical protein